MQNTMDRWILTFDGSCGKCTVLSEAVLQASGGRLDILPLTDPQVMEWRRRSLGSAPRWVPTLLRVGDDAVRAWTGPAMSSVLIRRLGMRRTIEVLRALGRVQYENRNGAVASDSSAAGRRRFLQLAGGAVTALGLTVAGQTPAFARSEHARASAWVEANITRLPRNYEGIVRHSMPYRKAIWRVLTPAEQCQVWQAHFRHYLTTHPDLPARRRKIVEEATDLAARTFASPSPLHDEIAKIEEKAKRVFGHAEARSLLATLGPDSREMEEQAATCNCTPVSDWCSRGCIDITCRQVNGCGTLYQYRCIGICS